jgi:hypothetical protein
MSAMLQFTVGLMTGLLGGFAIAVFRPLARIVLLAAVSIIAYVLFERDIPGLAASYEDTAQHIWRFAPFSVALACGVVMSATLAVRR